MEKTTRTGSQSQKWRSHGGLSVREWGAEGTGNQKHNWYAQNRQGEVKNNIGSVEAKEHMDSYELGVPLPL